MVGSLHLLRGLPLAAALFLCSLLSAPFRGAEPHPVGEAARLPEVEAEELGEGFVVWESNRTGDWRLWARRLDGTGLGQLTADEPGRQHCCAHISPDGAAVAYLSLPAGRGGYPPPGTIGELRLIRLPKGPAGDPGGGGATTLVSFAQGGARTYGRGNRAAVWRSSSELVSVDGRGRTVSLELGPEGARQSATVLLAGSRPELGFLVNRQLTHATSGEPSFSLYDRASRRVVGRPVLGGCEPYFSHDGRWGIWLSAVGGPIERFDLERRTSEILLRKNDPLLVGRGEKGYLYFPMVSRDGRLLAFGASPGAHDHHRADYDVYVAPTDPATLELLGAPVRVSDHPAADRYPDAFLEPLALGRHRGEAPYTVRLEPPALLRGEGPLRWELGDGAVETLAADDAVVHTFRRSGSYRVRVRRERSGNGSAKGNEESVGQVLVRPARPPRVTGVAVRGGGDRIVVRFDESVSVVGARAEVVGGPEVAGIERDDRGDGRVLVVRLAARLDRPATLLLAGVTDRAGRPNVLGPTRLELPAPTWPADREALAFLWRAGDGASPAGALRVEGAARLDRAGRMVLDRGAYWAEEAVGRRLLAAARSSNELSIETVLVAGRGRQGAEGETGEEARVITFSDGARGRNVTLGQRGDELVLRLRTESTGSNADRPRVTLFRVEPGAPTHLVVTYSPGKLTVYRNGERVLESAVFQGGFDHWTPKGLRFGSEWGAAWGGPLDWSGVLGGVALYGRVLGPEEVRENALRHRLAREEARQGRVPGS